MTSPVSAATHLAAYQYSAVRELVIITKNGRPRTV
jgi:hypothetical protein